MRWERDASTTGSTSRPLDTGRQRDRVPLDRVGGGDRDEQGETTASDVRAGRPIPSVCRCRPSARRATSSTGRDSVRHASSGVRRLRTIGRRMTPPSPSRSWSLGPASAAAGGSRARLRPRRTGSCGPTPRCCGWPGRDAGDPPGADGAPVRDAAVAARARPGRATPGCLRAGRQPGPGPGGPLGAPGRRPVGRRCWSSWARPAIPTLAGGTADAALDRRAGAPAARRARGATSWPPAGCTAARRSRSCTARSGSTRTPPTRGRRSGSRWRCSARACASATGRGTTTSQVQLPGDGLLSCRAEVESRPGRHPAADRRPGPRPEPGAGGAAPARAVRAALRRPDGRWCPAASRCSTRPGRVVDANPGPVRAAGPAAGAAARHPDGHACAPTRTPRTRSAGADRRRPGHAAGLAARGAAGRPARLPGRRRARCGAATAPPSGASWPCRRTQRRRRRLAAGWSSVTDVSERRRAAELLRSAGQRRRADPAAQPGRLPSSWSTGCWPGRAATGWPWSAATSTTSSASTPRSATRRATTCWSRWPGGCSASCPVGCTRGPALRRRVRGHLRRPRRGGRPRPARPHGRRPAAHHDHRARQAGAADRVGRAGHARCRPARSARPTCCASPRRPCTTPSAGSAAAASAWPPTAS